MKKPQEKSDEKEPLFISQEVINKFKSEMALFKNDNYKLMEAYRAMKKVGGKWIVFRYEGADIQKYQKYLERHGLADFDLFFDFSLPINYFQILLRKAKFE